MIRSLSLLRASALRLFALCSVMLLAACDPSALSLGGGGGPRSPPENRFLSLCSCPEAPGVRRCIPVRQSRERGASGHCRPAGGQDRPADLQHIRFRRRRAERRYPRVAEGAKVIIGPLYSEAANAAGLAAASAGVNVLAFSNNAAIAGGNVFVLGLHLRQHGAADGLLCGGAGKGNIFVVNDAPPAEETGRDSIARAIAGSKASLAGNASFELSQQGYRQCRAKHHPADPVLRRAIGVLHLRQRRGDPLLAQLLPEQGIGPTTPQFIGLTRLDIPPEALSQPGLQGAWFALPDPALYGNFRSRYASAYGGAPHPLAGLAYDGIAAVGALVGQANPMPLSRGALTTGAGFVGVNGIFRFRSDGTE